MRLISEVIVHCTATPPDMDVGREEIDRWHRRRGFLSDSGVPCGYHRIIRRDGTVEWGRPLSEIGAHCKGRNVYTVGIVLVGGVDKDGNPDCNYTKFQIESLLNEIKWMRYQFGNIKISGHREYADKACPCFDVEQFVDG